MYQRFKYVCFCVLMCILVLNPLSSRAPSSPVKKKISQMYPLRTDPIWFHLRPNSADYFVWISENCDRTLRRILVLQGISVFFWRRRRRRNICWLYSRRNQTASRTTEVKRGIENGHLEVEEIDNASDVDVFLDQEESKEYNSNRISEEEEVINTVNRSSTLSEINVKPFSIPHGPTKHFFNL